ncbi:unnamed protein product [Amoebophrya sp. A25]|nr:unnamed protein product [Amoebophrya sp. A25]|eukprot:GSA25T00003022001.1
MNAYADGGTPLDYILATRRGYLETRLKYLLEENANWCWSDLAYRIETLEQDKRATKTERQERRMELEGLRNARRIHSEGVAEATRIYNGRVHKQRKEKCRAYFAKRRRKRLWRELLELESLAGRREDRLRDNDHEDSPTDADQHQSDLLTSDASTGENFALTLPDFDEDQKMHGDDCGIEWPRDRMLNTRDAMGLPILTHADVYGGDLWSNFTFLGNRKPAPPLDKEAQGTA